MDYKVDIHKHKTEFVVKHEQHITKVIGHKLYVVGKGFKIGGTRSWRTNNPGNIKYGPFARKHGAIGTDGVNAIFPTEEVGKVAKIALLLGEGYRNKTLKRAIYKYAPPVENNSYRYYKYLVRRGVPTNKLLKSFTAEEFSNLVDRMKVYEGWREGRYI